ncbi:hypothetical protein H6G04_13875 [Calothrix membranacea FACHB-236]|nr:hypothetical protein [Calothrix membranacea FACHB-236]
MVKNIRQNIKFRQKNFFIELSECEAEKVVGGGSTAIVEVGICLEQTCWGSGGGGADGGGSGGGF